MTIINPNYHNLFILLKRMTIINPNFYNIIIHINGQNYYNYANSFPFISSLRFVSKHDRDGVDVREKMNTLKGALEEQLDFENQGIPDSFPTYVSSSPGGEPQRGYVTLAKRYNLSMYFCNVFLTYVASSFISR